MIKFEIRTDTLHNMCPECWDDNAEGKVVNKAYFFDGIMQTSWLPHVNDSVLINDVIQEAFQLGQKDMQKKIKDIFGP